MKKEIYPWLDAVYARAVQDPWHRECQAEVERLEPVFLRIRARLTVQEREELDQYIAACEELAHSLVYPAYEQGSLSVLSR